MRRRRGLLQADVAESAGVSQELISLIERGHGDRVSVRVLLAVAGALDARLVLQIRWRAGDLDRLLDADHSVVAAAMIQLLRAYLWDTRVEVTYSSRGATGSIDILAWHAPTGSLLVIEIKTEITSTEATLRRLDEKTRLAAAVARERFGWVATTVSKLLVIEDSSTNRRRVAGGSALFDAALPAEGAATRAWFRTPHGAVAGRIFLSPSNGGGGIQGAGGRHRVRRVSRRPIHPGLSVARDEIDSDDQGPPPGRTILVG